MCSKSCFSLALFRFALFCRLSSFLRRAVSCLQRNLPVQSLYLLDLKSVHLKLANIILGLPAWFPEMKTLCLPIGLLHFCFSCSTVQCFMQFQICRTGRTLLLCMQLGCQLQEIHFNTPTFIMIAWTVTYGKPFPPHRRLFDGLFRGPFLFLLRVVQPICNVHSTSDSCCGSQVTLRINYIY